MTTVLDVCGLSVEYRARGTVTRALDGVDLNVQSGEVMGLIGESGSGKSTLALAIGQLLPTTVHRVAGDLRFLGTSVFQLRRRELRLMRQERLGFVFQNPMSILDPTMTIQRQLSLIDDRFRSERERIDLLARVGLREPMVVSASYPHQLSGGMAQRVAIALAIARKPKLVVADEPTASLDVTLRGQILGLLVSLCVELGASVLLLSHDLHGIGKYLSRVAVMYGGRVVEFGPTFDVFHQPAHPYTQALLDAAPGTEGFGGRLRPIEGLPPMLTDKADHCSFAPRCHWAVEKCRVVRPESRAVAGREVLCHRAEDVLATPQRIARG